MLSLLSTLTLLVACNEKEPVSDTGSVIEDTGTEDTGTEDTDTSDTSSTDTEDTQDTQDTSDTQDTEDTSEPSLSNLDQEGPYTASSTSESLSLSSCDSPMNYTQVVTSEPNAPTVIISHGFLRDSTNMIEWGGHLGSWGFNAIVLDLCNTFDHQRNGEAVAELATTLGLSDVLYLGFSAGGLASLVAAANSNPLGVMTLDPVDDFGGTGSTLGGQVSSPVLGLIGEPSDCNSQNNSIGLLQTVGASGVFRVTDADHCDFEAPTNDLCENGVAGFGACGNSSASISDESIRATIREMATAGLLWMSGNNSNGEDWWTGSENQSLQSQGLISPL